MSIVTQDEETPFDFHRQQPVERNCKVFVNTLQGAAFDFSPILKSRLQNRALPHLHMCNEHHCAGRLGPIQLKVRHNKSIMCRNFKPLTLVYRPLPPSESHRRLPM